LERKNPELCYCCHYTTVRLLLVQVIYLELLYTALGKVFGSKRARLPVDQAKQNQIRPGTIGTACLVEPLLSAEDDLIFFDRSSIWIC
jgi:hypothetical protein